MADSTVYILDSYNCHPESFINTSRRSRSACCRLPKCSLVFRTVTHTVRRQHPQIYNKDFIHSWLPSEQAGSGKLNCASKGLPSLQYMPPIRFLKRNAWTHPDLKTFPSTQRVQNITPSLHFPEIFGGSTRCINFASTHQYAALLRLSMLKYTTDTEVDTYFTEVKFCWVGRKGQ